MLRKLHSVGPGAGRHDRLRRAAHAVGAGDHDCAVTARLPVFPTTVFAAPGHAGSALSPESPGRNRAREGIVRADPDLLSEAMNPTIADEPRRILV
jgi:hypothetical protein